MDEWNENIENYYAYLDGAPLSKISFVIPVVSFFKHNKIPVEIDWKTRHMYVKYHNRMLKKKEIQRILDHCGIREKAFFLIMAESGQRPRTIVQLRYKHIKEDFEAHRIPMKIELPAEILKDRVGQRFTFIGEDGFKALKEYLSPRMPLENNDLLFTLKKGKPKKSYLSPETFGNIFSATVLKLNLDEIVEKGKPKGLRLYCLRKYFRNNIKVSDIGYREFWMGHRWGTDEHYLTRDVERHRQEYTKAYPSIRVYQPETTKEIERLREENRLLKEAISKLTMEMKGIQFLLTNRLGVPEETVKGAIKDYIVVSKILDEPKEKPKKEEE